MPDPENLTEYPVGSSELVPFSRNVSDLDKLVNQTGTVNNRAGDTLKTWAQIQTEAETPALTEVWSGTATTSLDLTTLTEGYPGDGIYIVTFVGSYTGMIHFIAGEICYATPRGVSGSVEMNKSTSEVLSSTGGSFMQIRRLRGI